jgi:hypothetical protein
VTRAGSICRVIACLFVLAALGGVTPAASADQGSDMRIDRAWTSVRSAPVGTRVVFKVIAENAGPDLLESSLDVLYDEPRDARTGQADGYIESEGNLDIRHELCFYGGFGGGGPSADTPACEFGFIGVGDKVYVKVVARLIQRTSSHVAALGFRVGNESEIPDPNPSNNAVVSRILIT